MLETGQPLACFRSGQRTGGLGGRWSTHVRDARPGEKFQPSNGENLVLQPGKCCSSAASTIQPLALAGIMGGNESGVEQGMTDVFLEKCLFQSRGDRWKSLPWVSARIPRIALNVVSILPPHAGVMERATTSYWIFAVAGLGRFPKSGANCRGATPYVCGWKGRGESWASISAKPRIAEILQRLQFQSLRSADGVFHVTPPTYRFDLAIEEDLIEELARVHGYNHIPLISPCRVGYAARPEAVRAPSRLRQALVARDYQEVINYGFVDASWELELAGNKTPVALKNPLSSQMSVMRSSLLGGLIANLRFNLSPNRPECGYLRLAAAL